MCAYDVPLRLQKKKKNDIDRIRTCDTFVKGFQVLRLNHSATISPRVKISHWDSNPGSQKFSPPIGGLKTWNANHYIMGEPPTSGRTSSFGKNSDIASRSIVARPGSRLDVGYEPGQRPKKKNK